MLRASLLGVGNALPFRRVRVARISSSAERTGGHAHARAKLQLDSSLEALLKDVDISLQDYKSHHDFKHRELDVLSSPEQDTSLEFGPEQEVDEYRGRKSPAAHFGSEKIGSMVLPHELQNKINQLISQSDKPMLRQDALRLFQDTSQKSSEAEDEQWSSQFQQRYRSHVQASRLGKRDGTAFAAIALPAHYSAIFSVINHLKKRMDPGFNIKHVIDWGAATGSGLWASLHSFQKHNDAEGDNLEDLNSRNSTLMTYVGIDKRDGLTSIAKDLSSDLVNEDVAITWKKSYRSEGGPSEHYGPETLALSAFTLSSLPTPLARKALVKEMWDSGAHTMMILDHSTTDGFDAVAEAREYLLKLGRQVAEDSEIQSDTPQGSHVLAPCPHDKKCPLHHPGAIRLVCGFKQRIQRPPFIRHTKHSGQGHEDMDYSYVVVRRGSRPSAKGTMTGRLGDVGKRDLEKEDASNTPIKELLLHSEHEAVEHETAQEEIDADHSVTSITPLPQSKQDLESALRLEAYLWPRLIFNPLKRSGHVILDACTHEGEIMRMTIPRSQGKQPFYDARKSDWGDIFPHPPKNPPQVRHQPAGAKAARASHLRGQDIGKRKDSRHPKDGLSYDTLTADMMKNRKKSRRDRIEPHVGPMFTE